MSIITPAGKQDFVWSPKQGSLTKTAGTGSKQASDKDILFAAAKKAIKAQFDFDQLKKPAGEVEVCAPCGEKVEVMEGESAIGEETETDGVAGEEVVEDAASGKAVSPDAVKAVQELADKANKAEELAGKVEEAVSKVEEAIQEVKAVVGGEGEKDDAGAPKGKKEDKDEVEIEVEVEDEETDEKEEKEEKDEEGEKDEIVKESVEAATAKAEMRTAANDPDDLYKLSKISPTTRKKVYTFWKDYLDYAPDYCKLMVTDYEK
jgi:hypothetical protein